MPTNDSLKQALELYRGQERQLLADLQTVRLVIARMERDLGEPPTNPDISVNLADSLPPMVANVEVANGKKGEIRPDEFFGMTQAEAARKYLKRIGHAISFDELVAALQAGGCKVGGENPKRVLYISLVRNTRDFVPPQQGYIGLREFYPGGARPQRDRQKGGQSRAPKARRGKPMKKQGRTETKPPTVSARKPSELAEAVRSVLADKQAHSIDEILKGVAARVGHAVGRIGIQGSLNSKAVEKVDGKYRLR